MVAFSFDATNVDPNTDFPVLPAGFYKAQIVKSEVVNNKDANTGSHLKLDVQVIEPGDFENQMLFDRLNLWHSGEKARDFAAKRFSQVCHATGVLKPNDTDELNGRPIVVKISVRTYEGKESNEIEKYEEDPVYGQGASSYKEAPSNSDNTPPAPSNNPPQNNSAPPASTPPANAPWGGNRS